MQRLITCTQLAKARPTMPCIRLVNIDMDAVDQCGACSGSPQLMLWSDNRGSTTQVVQYGAIDHVPSYNLSHGVVLFFSNCTTCVVPPLERQYRVVVVHGCD